MMTEADRRDIEALLPWYAAGTLDTQDKARVDAALAVDPALRTLLRLTRDEMSETIVSNERTRMPPPRALEALFARIDAEPARGKPLSRSLLDFGGRLADLFTPRTLGWVTTAAAVAIVAQAGMLAGTMIDHRGGAQYETASSNTGNGPAETGNFVLVGFQPEATSEMISRLLEDVGGAIVDGPRPGGLYRVRLPATRSLDGKAATAARRLEEERAVVRLVLPAS